MIKHTINESYYWSKLIIAFSDKNNIYISKYHGILSYLGKFLRDMFIVILVSHYNNGKYHLSIEYFISQYGLDILLEYNEICRILINHIYYIADYVYLISLNINEEIIDIDILGDAHPGFLIKTLIITRSSKYIVYGSDIDFNNPIVDIISKVDSNLLDCFVYYKTMGAIKIRDYFDINISGTNGQYQTFFAKLGSVLPYILLFRISDLYYENMLCSIPSPKFFDIEVNFFDGDNYDLFSAGIISGDIQSSHTSLNGLFENISYTTPFVSSTSNSKSGNQSTVEWIKTSNSKKYSVPYSEVKYHKDTLISFYDNSYNNIISNLAYIEDQANDISMYSRNIIRPTREYIMLLRLFQYGLINNKNLIFSDRIKTNMGDYITNSNFIESKGLFELELSYLNKGIIPSYYTDIKKTEVFSADLKSIVGYKKVDQYTTWSNNISQTAYFLTQQKNSLKQYL